MRLPKPKSVEVSITDEALDGLEILHLSDLHLNTGTSSQALLQLVEICNAMEADFIVITGDIIDTKAELIKDKLKILSSLHHTVYWISGNHDLYYGLEALKKELPTFIFMDNHCITIPYNNSSIHLAGLPDRFSKFFKIKRNEEKIFNFLSKNCATIFLAHQPKDYKIATQSHATLFLCGHTHGGQIFPFHLLVRLVQPFLKGLHYREKTAIYVNSGLGYWGIKYRFKAPNEITLLKLVYNNA